MGLREGLPLLEGPVSSGPGRKRPPLCQLARTPSPPGSPGVQVRTVRSQSLAHGPLGQRVAELGLLEESLLLGVPAVGFESRALSFDPAVGPSGSVPWLLVGEGTAVCRQHGSVGRWGAGHVPGDGASDGATGRGTGGRRKVSPGRPRPQASPCVGSVRPPGVWCSCGQVPACLCPGEQARCHLQELLAEWQSRQHRRSACGQLRRVAVLGLVWLLCLGTTLGCTLAVYTFSELMIKVRRGRGRPPRRPGPPALLAGAPGLPHPPPRPPPEDTFLPGLVLILVLTLL